MGGMMDSGFAERVARLGRDGSRVAAIATVLWWIGLAIEYRFDLFPPGEGHGAPYQLNQAIFMVSLILLAVAILIWRGSPAAGGGRWLRAALAVQAAGVAVIVGAGLIMNLITRSDENPMFPLGALAIALGGVVVAVSAVMNREMSLALRLALTQFGLAFVVLLMIAPPVLLGRNEPTWLLEALWGLSWLVAASALGEWWSGAQRAEGTERPSETQQSAASP
jgi:hypothetical protein